ncbi:Phytochelatin synthase-domain-containing protein [Jimgerdemannia flammicorona]|uniref:glutathione gamma-glutamylcysteinyltransferase n=1 Tax=Jimgerdemannia flammicorona TaxID=994334 RepID=A0A433DK73_9FUNG|nr:Phytochelatin synthase-domain-containing protein [Jimgerdemannia flammicorona]
MLPAVASTARDVTRSLLTRHAPATVLRRSLFVSRPFFLASPTRDIPTVASSSSSSSPLRADPPASTSSPLDVLLTLPNAGTGKDSVLESTFYQRKLPSELVRFSSAEGKALFREAMDQGHAEGFFSLTGNFTTQSEPAYCGPSSLAMVLNALEVDPKQRWKGNWRWYSDELLECCSPREVVKKNGITFDQFACKLNSKQKIAYHILSSTDFFLTHPPCLPLSSGLAKCHCDVIVKRASTTPYEEFLSDLATVTSRSDLHMVVSFSRAGLHQTGDGHFSPIGSYNALRNVALVLDVARYKYPSYWSDTRQLYEAMKPADPETGRGRGYFLLSYERGRTHVSLCGVAKKEGEVKDTRERPEEAIEDRGLQNQPTQHGTKLNWATLAKTFCKDIPQNLWDEKPRTLERVVDVVLRNVPREYGIVLAMRQSISSASPISEDDVATRRDYITTLLHDTARSPLYSIVASAIGHSAQPQNPDHHAAFATLFLLASPATLYASLPRELLAAFEECRRPEAMTLTVAREVERVAEEIRELMGAFCTCGTRGKTEGGKGTSEEGGLCGEKK